MDWPGRGALGASHGQGTEAAATWLRDCLGSTQSRVSILALERVGEDCLLS